MNPRGLSPSGRRSSSNGQQLDTVIMTLDLFQNVFEVSDILVPLKGAVRATKLILDARQADDNNTKAWGDLRQRLDDYMAATKKEVDLFEKYSPEERRRDESFIQPLFEHAGYLKHMRDTLAKMMEKPSSSRMNVFQASRISKKDAKLVRQLDLEIEERHRVFTDLLAAYRLQVVARSTEADEKSLLLQLPSVTFVPFSIHTACIQGTRQIVLETISQWADDDEPGKPIFWLCDVAGSGKSSVAMSASESWRTRKMLGGQFFFSMGDSEASNTERFCSTMARELAYHIPELAPHIAKAIKGNPAIMRSSFDEQFRAFVIGPLQYQQKRVVLVIDAIDECKSGSQRKVLLEMLATATRENRNLRIFITGRPDPVTEAVLQSLSIAAKMENRLHDIKYQDNFDDIALYVHQRLDGVLPKEKRQRLIEKANGGFIRAATVCRMLTEDTNMNSPENIYDHLISLEWDGPMEDLRGPFFQRIGSKDTESRIQEQQLEPISISIQEGPLEQLMRLRPPLDLTGEVSLDSTTKLLRSGSYANVYPVEYLGEKVAIKVLKFRRSKNQKKPNRHEELLTRRTDREIKVWAALSHPHILPFLGFTTNHGDFCSMVSPWCEHGHAEAYLTTQESVSLAERLRLTRQVASGLQYLHGLKIIHGDLKPNILIDDQCNALLADFGLVGLEDGWGPRGMTTPSAYMGTEIYMAPEVFDNESAKATKESDIWAFGCVALEFVEEVEPYRNVIKRVDLKEALFCGQKPATQGDGANVSAGVESPFWNLLNACWDYDPWVRPSIEDIVVCLDAIAKNQESSTPEEVKGGIEGLSYS